MGEMFYIFTLSFFWTSVLLLLVGACAFFYFWRQKYYEDRQIPLVVIALAHVGLPSMSVIALTFTMKDPETSWLDWSALAVGMLLMAVGIVTQFQSWGDFYSWRKVQRPEADLKTSRSS